MSIQRYNEKVLTMARARTYIGQKALSCFNGKEIAVILSLYDNCRKNPETGLCNYQVAGKTDMPDMNCLLLALKIPGYERKKVCCRY